MFNKFRAVGACLLGLFLFTGVVADEQDDAMAKRCIGLIRIDKTEVIDDQTILFYMRGGEIYKNALPHRCIGLQNERTFMYRTTISELCDLDVVTVLYNQGFGFTPGASCGLGRFYPISADEAKLLKDQPPAAVPERHDPGAEVEDVEKPAQ